jgi:hypothetical protein
MTAAGGKNGWPAKAGAIKMDNQRAGGAPIRILIGQFVLILALF